jgi:hypothetical protein
MSTAAKATALTGATADTTATEQAPYSANEEAPTSTSTHVRFVHTMRGPFVSVGQSTAESANAVAATGARELERIVGAID